jgi:ATPase family associated with various cellular activities (AAA)
MYYQELFAEALQEPVAAIPYQVSRHLAASYPERAMIEGSDCDFANLAEFARAGRCVLRPEPSIHNQFSVWWSGDKTVMEQPRNVWYEVEWEGHQLDVVFMHWGDDCSVYHWILADSDDVARRFYAAVCGHRVEIHDEVLVYDGGHWRASGQLFRQIGGTTFDNLILPDALKRAIQSDVERFFASKEVYERYGVPWKRGLLFVGPPGNGKTHAIKALIHATGLPCLYIKTFDSDAWAEETGIRRVFERARSASPCLLVLEDLDSLVSAENRSFFLNEMDGFAANVGILTIATTNHPAKLDPAILDRPSRFDRKYHFGLPERVERLAYIQRWNSSLEPEARLTKEGENQAAERTDGFSFAYLKELFLSSLMGWVAERELKTMDAMLLEQVVTLREQMKTTGDAASDSSKDPA